MFADRETLETEWLHLTRVTMPGIAAERAWPVRNDHCFQRILLDNAVGGVWYDHIPARPAYRHADDALLARAVALGKACVDGSEGLDRLNQRSLAWRKQKRLVK